MKEQFVVNYDEPLIPPDGWEVYADFVPRERERLLPTGERVKIKNKKLSFNIKEFKLFPVGNGFDLNPIWKRSSLITGDDIIVDRRMAEAIVQWANDGKLNLDDPNWEKGVLCFGTILKKKASFAVSCIVLRSKKNKTYKLVLRHMDKSPKGKCWGFIHKNGKAGTA